jgi:hypothetical protein
MESGLDAGGISSGIWVEIEWTNNLVSQNIMELFILHDRWIQINPNVKLNCWPIQFRPKSHY